VVVSTRGQDRIRAAEKEHRALRDAEAPSKPKTTQKSRLKVPPRLYHGMLALNISRREMR